MKKMAKGLYGITQELEGIEKKVAGIVGEKVQKMLFNGGE